MIIDPVKFHQALGKRRDLFETEIHVAEIENRLADIVAMKAAELIIDALAGALAQSLVSDPEDQIPWE